MLQFNANEKIIYGESNPKHQSQRDSDFKGLLFIMEPSCAICYDIAQILNLVLEIELLRHLI